MDYNKIKIFIPLILICLAIALIPLTTAETVCCYDSQQGICSLNADKNNCVDGGGNWSSDATCNAETRCAKGCCIAGNIVAFTTERRCEVLSSAYGVAKMQGAKILEFIEKPANPPSNLINAGLYILEPEVIDMVPEGFCMVEKQIFPNIAQDQKLYGYHFTGQWYDTGNLERYAKALKEWKGLH